MLCPKCQKTEALLNQPAIARVNSCPECGWFEVTMVRLEPGMDAVDRMHRADVENRLNKIGVDTRNVCFLCGKTRQVLDASGTKLILGVHGGVCADCVALCNDVLKGSA